MKKITIIWSIIMFLLVVLIVLIGVLISKKETNYKALESDIVEAMKVYYGQDTNLAKLPKKKNKTSKVTIGELEAFGHNINNIVDGDTCTGYGIVTKKDIAFGYKAYIKCSNYETKGYNSK